MKVPEGKCRSFRKFQTGKSISIQQLPNENDFYSSKVQKPRWTELVFHDPDVIQIRSGCWLQNESGEAILGFPTRFVWNHKWLTRIMIKNTKAVNNGAAFLFKSQNFQKKHQSLQEFAIWGKVKERQEERAHGNPRVFACSYSWFSERLESDVLTIFWETLPDDRSSVRPDWCFAIVEKHFEEIYQHRRNKAVLQRNVPFLSNVFSARAMRFKEVAFSGEQKS